jgi:hypothetical protein
MDNFTLFELLLHAEAEDEVESVLSRAGYLHNEASWRPLGFENNFAAISNQQSDPSGALVEKVINGIDAVLMAECYGRGINPESPQAPRSMAKAVEQFFNVRDGRLDNLTSSELTRLADSIQLVAVGSKENPNYLIIDRGEGQTPASFPDTFLSLLRSNKIRIPFVQGKFNSGGTGILQFCGNKNFELIVSRRRPGCPVNADDETADLWGFTIVRRLLPSGGRRSSMYVYLAPGGEVPTFQAAAIRVLPGKSSPNRASPPYALTLPHGTCVKLYDYRWKAKSTLTTEGRYELERFLHSPCLPFRVTESREYKANYYSATVSGGWATATSEGEDGDGRKLEPGFPAYAELNIPKIGRLPYQMAVFKPGTNPRHVPYGVYFALNGQVHGALPSDFVTRRLKFDYLVGKKGPLLVSVDCTAMDERVREDFFMASRDRIRRNEVYGAIEEMLTEALRGHAGLQEINQRRRKEELEAHLNEDTPLDAFQNLLDLDPALSNLFALGDRLVVTTGPVARPPFVGRKFPTFFRISSEPKEGLTKTCPVNRTCRVEFETDAANDYFVRVREPGQVVFDPPDLVEYSHLWNGHFETRFRVPWNAQPGDVFTVRVVVTDLQREFVSNFLLRAAPEVDDEPEPGRRKQPRGPSTGGARRGVALALPTIKEIHRNQWDDFDPPFHEYDAIRIKHDGRGGYDCSVNVDSMFLINEVARAKEDDKPLVKFWFSYGLVLSAMGMIRQQLRLAERPHMDTNGDHVGDASDEVDLPSVSLSCGGLAQVIVPIIRTLYRGPAAAAN